MSVPPHNGPNDPSGYGPPQGYPQQQPTYPAAQPAGFGQSTPYGQAGGNVQPGYGQMPPVPSGGFGPDATRRPGMVTAAAVLAFVVGGLYVLGGLLALVGGTAAGLSGLFTLIAVLLLAVGGVLIWGGIAALGGRDARILTVAAGVGIVLNLISLIGSFDGRSLTGLIIPGLILYFLLNTQSKAWFDRVGGKHF